MVSAKTRMFVICKNNKHRVNIGHHELTLFWCETSNYIPAPRRGRGVYCLTIVAEKNATKNEHIKICSMCIKINKVSRQEVGI
jgi:hypothetical protein